MCEVRLVPCIPENCLPVPPWNPAHSVHSHCTASGPTLCASCTLSSMEGSNNQGCIRRNTRPPEWRGKNDSDCWNYTQVKEDELVGTSLFAILTFTGYGEMPVSIKSKLLHKNLHLLDTAHLFKKKYSFAWIVEPDRCISNAAAQLCYSRPQPRPKQLPRCQALHSTASGHRKNTFPKPGLPTPSNPPFPTETTSARDLKEQPPPRPPHAAGN